MIALLLALALADEPADTAAPALPNVPAEPERPPDRPGDCPDVQAAPAEATRDCAAVSVPPSYYAHLQALRVHTDALSFHLAISEAMRTVERDAWARDVAQRDAEIARLLAPTPFWQRPGTQVALGVVGGGGAVLLGGWAVGQVAK